MDEVTLTHLAVIGNSVVLFSNEKKLDWTIKKEKLALDHKVSLNGCVFSKPTDGGVAPCITLSLLIKPTKKWPDPDIDIIIMIIRLFERNGSVFCRWMWPQLQ